MKIRTKIKSGPAKIIFFLAISLAIYFSFGLFHLGKFDTADEHFWINNDRIAQYWNSIGNHDWKHTRINDKPGITLAYVSGLALPFDHRSDVENESDERGVFTKYDPLESERINFIYRLPLIIFNGIFSVFFFWVIKKLTDNRWIALWSSILILLSPILLGVSQIVNPDALSWLFGSATIFSFLLYLKNTTLKNCLLAGLFFGLALATKYIALIIFYYLFLAALAYFFWEYEKGRKITADRIRNIASGFILFTLCGFLVFSLLMPAVFVKKSYLFDDVINFHHTGIFFRLTLLTDAIVLLDSLFFQSRGIFWIMEHLKKIKRIILSLVLAGVLLLSLLTLINWALGINAWNLEAIPYDSRQSDLFIALPLWQKIILEIRPLLFSLTPIVLLSLLFIWARSLYKKSEYEFLVFILSSFIAVYWVAMIYMDLLVNIRYGIILQPISIFLASIGLWIVFSLPPFTNINKSLITAGLIILSTVSLWMIKPFYFNYTNNLLPQENLITGAWGYGGYEAANFINSRSNGPVTVIADYPGTCPFVRGWCVDISNDNKEKVIAALDKDEDDAYLVLSRRGQVRWNYIGQFGGAMKKAPLWELDIDDRPGNFVRVYKQD